MRFSLRSLLITITLVAIYFCFDAAFPRASNFWGPTLMAASVACFANQRPWLGATLAGTFAAAVAANIWLIRTIFEFRVVGDSDSPGREMEIYLDSLIPYVGLHTLAGLLIAVQISGAIWYVRQWRGFEKVSDPNSKPPP